MPTSPDPAPAAPSLSAPAAAASTSPSRSVHHTLPLLGSLTVLGSAALFGTLGPLSRFAYDLGVSPSAWVAWRAAIGLLTLLAIIAWRSRSGSVRIVRPVELSTRARTSLLLAGFMGFTLNVGMFVAFDLVTVAIALLCFYTYPAMVAVVNTLMGRERLDGPRLLALGLALVGMVAVVTAQLDPAAGIRVDPLGIGLAIGAAVSQTVYVVVSRDGYHEVPTEQAIAVVLAITVVGSTALAVIGGSGAALLPPGGASGFLPLVLFAGIFAAAIPSLGFLAGIRAIGGLRAGILMLFEPVVGVSLAAWLLGESLAPIQVLGAIAILGAAVILQRAAPGADEPGPHTAVALGGGP